MDLTSIRNNKTGLTLAAVCVAVGFLYSDVVVKLVRDWWSDENYSHGLLVPFVIGLIVWNDRQKLFSRVSSGWTALGWAAIASAILLLLIGLLGAEIFAQRISFVLMLAGLVVYFAGVRVLWALTVPFILLLLSIPIPQIVFNRIAFPLQVWASQLAVVGIRLFDVPTVRMGNVIDVLPRGATQTIALEVVEACSGIRSLMTLVTLAVILVYFTRTDENGRFGNLSGKGLLRTGVLTVLAVFIAVFTNSARVTATGVHTYYAGKQATEPFWHDASGWVAYAAALGLLIGANILLKKLLKEREGGIGDPPLGGITFKLPRAFPLVIALVLVGLGVNWLTHRTEASVPRRSLTQFSDRMGRWTQIGEPIKFDPAIETMLKTTDYTMREYVQDDGRRANIYVGYYGSQRTGATYHSPQNCLPGAGWVMRDPERMTVTLADGTSFEANRYIIENGLYKEVMVYWYQGRGRRTASEYLDKAYTIWDSISRGRTDGALVRVMTTVGGNEEAATLAAAELSSLVAERLSDHVPQ
jgi:exosortase D (VPLPA-CTERM-specific)